MLQNPTVHSGQSKAAMLPAENLGRSHQGCMITVGQAENSVPSGQVPASRGKPCRAPYRDSQPEGHSLTISCLLLGFPDTDTLYRELLSSDFSLPWRQRRASPPCFISGATVLVTLLQLPHLPYTCLFDL